MDEKKQVFVTEFLKTLDPIAAAQAAGLSPRGIYGLFKDAQVKQEIRGALSARAYLMRVLADESCGTRERIRAADLLLKQGMPEEEIKITVEYV